MIFEPLPSPLQFNTLLEWAQQEVMKTYMIPANMLHGSRPSSAQELCQLHLQSQETLLRYLQSEKKSFNSR